MRKRTRSNIVLITVDSLRPDFLGCYNPKRPISPNIDKLARRSIIFLNAIASSVPTWFSFPSIMCGTRPFEYGKYLGIPEFSNVKTIAETLKENGYFTMAFISDNPALYGDLYGFNRGFDVYKDRIDTFENSVSKNVRRSIAKRIKNFLTVNKVGEAFISAISNYNPVYPAEDLNSGIFDFLDSKRVEPFFLWVHYMDTHEPYASNIRNCQFSSNPILNLYYKIRFYFKRYKHLEKMRVENPVDMKIIKKLYVSSVKYVDAKIGNLLTFLSSKGLVNNSYIFLTSDHGESFMEHGYFYHEPFHLYNELIKVPLLIQTPTLEHKLVDDVVSLKSLAKTINSIASCNEKTFKGVNILNLNSKRPNFADKTTEILWKCKAPHIRLNIRSNRERIKNYERMISYTTKNLKYIVNLKTGQEEVYNLSQDKNEKHNLIGNLKSIDKIRKKMRNYIEK